MKYKYLIVITFIIAMFNLSSNEIEAFFLKELANNPEFMKTKLKYEKIIGNRLLDNSDKYGTMNFSYNYYDNDVEREETKSTLEKSIIDELDKRFKVEYKKQFFPIDFDSSIDNFSSKFDEEIISYEILKSKLECLEYIIDDYIEAYKLTTLTEINSFEQSIAQQKLAIISELNINNVSEPEQYIEINEDIDDLNDEIEENEADLVELYNTYDTKIADFNNIVRKQDILQASVESDSVSKTSDLDSPIYIELKDSKGSLKWKKFYSFLPEINLSLSYNYRKTTQDWEVTETGMSESFDRVQEEDYPEGELSLSIPLNLISNLRGKHKILNYFKQEVNSEQFELNQWFNKYKNSLVKDYASEVSSIKRKTEIFQLHKDNLLRVNQIVSIDSLDQNSSSEWKLDILNNKLRKAKLKTEIAKLNHIKTLILSNIFKEEFYDKK